MARAPIIAAAATLAFLAIGTVGYQLGRSAGSTLDTGGPPPVVRSAAPVRTWAAPPRVASEHRRHHDEDRDDD